MNTTCYLCESKEYKTVFLEHEIPIVKCKSCGHVYSTFEQSEHYDGYWGEGNAEFDLDWWDNAHRKIYSQFINNFLTTDSGSVLDVGCGLGYFVKMVGETKPGWKAVGYEMSSAAVKFAKEKNHLNNVFEGMVEKSGIAPGSIDIITMWDVIEHIPRPQPLLKYLHSLLKPGGILFMQTPNVPVQLLKANLKVLIKGMKPDGHYMEARDHINDYSINTLRNLSKQTGFKSAEFMILTPILSFAGSKSFIGKYSKLAFYYFSNLIWHLSFKTLMVNNTLFSSFYK